MRHNSRRAVALERVDEQRVPWWARLKVSQRHRGPAVRYRPAKRKSHPRRSTTSLLPLRTSARMVVSVRNNDAHVRESGKMTAARPSRPNLGRNPVPAAGR
jgi:hypothetical protein